jgi:hypothetical protein
MANHWDSLPIALQEDILFRAGKMEHNEKWKRIMGDVEFKSGTRLQKKASDLYGRINDLNKKFELGFANGLAWYTHSFPLAEEYYNTIPEVHWAWCG